MFMFEKALRGGRGYWGWMAALLAVACAGAWGYAAQLQIGLGVTGLSRDVTWGLYIAQFTFLVGVAASAVMVVLPYYLHDYKLFGRLTILGEFLAISAVAMCGMFIVADMGQPSRVLNVLLHPTPQSMMFWDMAALGGYLVLNIIITRVTLNKRIQPTSVSSLRSSPAAADPCRSRAFHRSGQRPANDGPSARHNGATPGGGQSGSRRRADPGPR
jgi:Ni/Fe-hydrogenase subunit HybB-like protein